jgi:hypothetical protein
MGLLPAVEDVAYTVDEASLLDEHGRRFPDPREWLS